LPPNDCCWHPTQTGQGFNPTHIANDPPMMDSIFQKQQVAMKTLFHLLKKELRPHYDSAYPTQPYRMLIGHSFGGLTVMNVFIIPMLGSMAI